MTTATQDENFTNLSDTKNNSPTKDDQASAEQSELCEDKVKDNPYIENRKPEGATLNIKEREPFAPRPFNKIKNVIIVSYICYLFLFFPGAFANKYAWEAKKYKELGAYSEAKEMVRTAVKWIYVGFAIGGLCLVIGLIVMGVELSKQ